MGKHKSDEKKKKKKTSQLVIRIEPGERDAFVALCDALDTSAAREIRRFMRDWVAAHTPQPEAPQESAVPSAEPPAAQAAEPSSDEAAAKPQPPRRRRKPAVDATA